MTRWRPALGLLLAWMLISPGHAAGGSSQALPPVAAGGSRGSRSDGLVPTFYVGSALQPLRGAFLRAAACQVLVRVPGRAAPLTLGRAGGPASSGWPALPGIEPRPARDPAPLQLALRELREQSARSHLALPRTLEVRFVQDGFAPRAVQVPLHVFQEPGQRWPRTGFVALRPLMHRLTFDVRPVRSEVRLESANGRFLGRAGEPVMVAMPLFLGVDGRYADRALVYLHEGYRTRSEVVRPHQLLKSSRWPLEGSVQLVAASRWVALRDAASSMLLPVLVLGAASAAAGAWLVRRRRVELGELKRLKEKAESTEPFSEEDHLKTQRVVGGWILDARLGKGGSATVYRTRRLHGDDLQLAEVAAIKLLDEDAAEEPAERLRFEREIQISCRLSHPNIVRILDFGIEAGTHYMVMELMEGATLRRIIAQGPMPFDQFATVLGLVLDAVCHAHQAGVVHRDIKPENILTTARGVPKIADFGIARGQAYATVTTTGRAIGTMAYLPPERFVGAEVDGPLADQYALGVMGYEMLAGARPYADTALGEVLLGIVRNPPVPLPQLRSDVPEEVDRVLARMRSLNPEERYLHLTDARDALAAAILAG